MLGAILTFIIALLATALVLWIVSRFNLGISVDSFTSAIIAGLVIGLIVAVVNWLFGLLGINLGSMGGLLGWIINIVIAALILMFGASFLPGLKTNGFVGAIIAAIAIGVVGWLINWVLGSVWHRRQRRSSRHESDLQPACLVQSRSYQIPPEMIRGR